MARGQRGARSAPAGNQKQTTEEDGQNSNNKSARPRRQKNLKEEEPHRAVDDSPPSHTSISVEAKREHHNHQPKAAPQPTSEQLMIAQLIGGDNKADDPNQRQKIQKVMDFTGFEEDAVATALFDAQWDEGRAIELLLEESEQLTAWEETGSKKKKNKNKQAADEAAKEDWDDGDNFANQDSREKSRSRGPPRMRRGGSQAQSGNRNRDFDEQQPQYQGGNQTRGTGPRRGDGAARRGGPGNSRGGGGGRSFQSRPLKPDQQSNSSGTAAFSGSIDTWNNPASAGSSSAPDRAPGSAGPDSAPGGPTGPKRMSRNSGGGKDAFDNAGNWGDDFPAADDWDNEEYTGSLADTKVFTARSSIGPGSAKPTTAAAVAGGRPQSQDSQQSQATQPPPGQQQPQSAVAQNSTVIGQNRSFSATVNGPPPTVSASPGVPPTTSYSQSIDLSTLLQKPTTQSTLSSPPLQQQQQSLLQFNQQATDSLRAGLGIGQSTASKAPGNLNSYAAYANPASAFSSNPPSNSFGQGSAFTSIKPSQSPSNTGSQNIQQQRTSVPPQQPKGPVPQMGIPPSSSASQVRPRMPPSSKIPSSAVEMPGDNVAQLDVQFGGLDLKFGSGTSIGLPSVSMPSQSNVQMPVPSVSSSIPPASMSSVAMPAVTMPSKQISNGYQSSGSVLPKSSTSVSATGSAAIKSGPQQQHQSDSLGSYSSYGGYGQQQQQQSKPSYQHQYQNQYGGYSDQNSYQSSSNSGYGSQNNYSSSSTPSSGYKNSGNHYQHESLNKFDSMSSSSSSMAVNNAAAAVLGLTTTTNALTGKVSATTAGKVPNVPNLPPGVASMLPQHFMTSLPPAAYYGLQQPSAAAAMYSAYGNAGGLDDLAAMQRSAGLHTLVGASNNPTVPQPGGLKAPSSGYYDPSTQYATGSLGGSRNDGSSNLNSQLGGNNSSATTAAGSSGSNSSSDKTGGFGGSVAVSSTDSNSSPIPSTGLQSSQSQQQQQQAAAQQASFNLAASSAFAAQQHMPPGYAYFYGGVPSLQAYGAATAATGYPGALTVPTAGGGSSNSQFQKTYSYGGSAYDNLGQAGNKDFTSSYSAGNGAGKSTAGGSQGPNAAGHQYWGNSPLASGQLW